MFRDCGVTERSVSGFGDGGFVVPVWHVTGVLGVVARELEVGVYRGVLLLKMSPLGFEVWNWV